MSWMDRLTDDALESIAHGNSICTMAHVQRMAHELLDHRRASQAAPAPSDGLREAWIAGRDAARAGIDHVINRDIAEYVYSAIDELQPPDDLTPAPAQVGELSIEEMIRQPARNMGMIGSSHD